MLHRHQLTGRQREKEGPGVHPPEPNAQSQEALRPPAVQEPEAGT